MMYAAAVEWDYGEDEGGGLYFLGLYADPARAVLDALEHYRAGCSTSPPTSTGTCSTSIRGCGVLPLLEFAIRAAFAALFLYLFVFPLVILAICLFQWLFLRR